MKMDEYRLDEVYDFSDSKYIPEKSNPLNETVEYKIGGTIYEVSTSCEGSETLFSKVLRLMKKEESVDDK